MNKYLENCIEAALAGGNAIVDYIPGVGDVKFKGDRGHATVGPADYISQDAVLNYLMGHDLESLFMTEEIVKNEEFKKRLIGSADLDKMRTSGVYIIDELDYTPGHSRNSFTWCVSVGYVKNMEHIAGAIYAPNIFCGTIYYGSREDGVFVNKNIRTTDVDITKKIQVNQNNILKKSIIYFGVRHLDGYKWPIHNKLLDGRLYSNVWFLEESPSCALGLGRVAAGEAEGYIQPPQSPWDWAAGKVLVEEAGGKFIPYELEKSKIKFIDKLEPEHYIPDRVGFITGNEKICDELIKTLLEVRL